MFWPVILSDKNLIRSVIVPPSNYLRVVSEKTRLKKLMKIIIIIIMNKSQETTDFSGHQKLTSTMKLRPGK